MINDYRTLKAENIRKRTLFMNVLWYSVLVASTAFCLGALWQATKEPIYKTICDGNGCYSYDKRV